MKNLKRIRKSKRMTQAELGLLVGIDQSTLSQYENGTRTPSVVVIKKIATILGVSMDELL